MARRPRKPSQLSMHLPTWGGARKGAGRKPKGPRAGVSHLGRDSLQPRFPVHVTLRVKEHVYNLRSKRCFTKIALAFAKGRDRFGFRLVHFSVQGNHLHLLCEAENKRALARGIQGLSIRMAKGLNRVMGTRGRVFADRYHSRILKTPREVKHALSYVHQNARHHGEQFGQKYRAEWTDPYSSADVKPSSETPAPVLVAQPQSWLLKGGWTRAAGPPDAPS